LQSQQTAKNLSITGFGACMIAGYPLSVATGFLYQAVQRLHQSGEFKLVFDIVAMGGFPAHRAHKHLTKKVLPEKPDIVVLQFGSTDASAPLRNNFISRRRTPKKQRSEKVSQLPPSSRDIMKWKLRSLGSELLLVPPNAAQDVYLTAVLRMVDECVAAGCKVIVVSPFVMGGGRSDRFARRYAEALRENLPKIPEVHFLNAHALLAKWPRKQMLLRDGFHLSAEAHEKLGFALAETIAKAAQTTN
jgi:lysophospholipase L1-like esterase